MNRMEHAEKLLSLVEEGTSPFHVAASVERQLKKAGFQRLAMGQDWSLENGGRYYLVHNGSSLAAFTIGNVSRLATPSALRRPTRISRAFG